MFKPEDKTAALEKKILELREAVEKQNQMLAKWKRDLEDILYNLDEDNLGANFKVSLGGMSTSIEQNEREIRMQASKLAAAETAIGDVREETALLVISAGEISSTVGKIFGEAAASDAKPTNTSAFDKSKLYFYNGAYWYYDDYEGKWKQSSSESVVSQIVQTPTGFALKGTVKLDGNALVNGTVKTFSGTHGVIIGGENYNGVMRTVKTVTTASGDKVEYTLLEITTGSARDETIGSDETVFSSKNGSYLSFEGALDFSGASVHGLYAKFAPDPR